ncbi:hypothetical protein BGW39_007814 [Mortierella sp. 14UC]|nr:hypothetical protein BGW39_007814 [Mortierella sp. 14UC]
MKQPTFNNTKCTSHLSPSPFSILIAGAGIGGLVMGLMLEQAKIPFLILERTAVIRPTGGAISLCPNVMRAMDQLGLKAELARESLPIEQIWYYDRMDNSWSKADSDGVTDMLFCETRYGNAIRTIPRSALVDLLLARIPRYKVLLGKRVVRTKETTLSTSPKLGGEKTGYVTCYCDDGSEYQGSILVGADGTYSAVRKSIYQSLPLDSDHDDEKHEDEMEEFMRVREERVMPHQHCVVGITKPLDPLEFEALGQEYGEFHALRGQDYKHSIWLMPLKNYRIAWNVFFHFPEDLLQEYKDLQTPTPTPTFNLAFEGSHFSFPGQYKISPTSPTPPSSRRSSVDDGSWKSLSKRVHDRAQAALEDLRDVPNPLSTLQGRFGDLLDETDPEKISRVTLEQGVFRRWFHGRTVLIGDAAHKSLPYAGQGANQAILDCIYLVSKIYLLVKPATVPAELAAARSKVSMPTIPPIMTRFRMSRLTSALSSLTPKSTTTPASLKSTSPSPKPKWRTPKNSELTSIFEQYYAERSAIAQQATWGGSWADTIFGGQGWGARIVRFAFFKLMPVRAFYMIVEACHLNNSSLAIRSDNWICTISQQLPAADEDGLENDLEVTVALQRPERGEESQVYSRVLSQYSNLSIIATTSENGRLGVFGGRDGEGEQGGCLQEMTIHRPEMLLQGVKVYVEPGSVRCGQRYIFDIQLHSHKQIRVRRQQQQQQHQQQERRPQHYLHPYHWTPLAPKSTPISPSISALQTSEIFITAKQRMKELLERPRGADIQITFSQQPATATPSPTPSSPSLSEHSFIPPTLSADLARAFLIPDELRGHGSMREEIYRRLDAPPAGLLVHSCILSTITSPAMRSLLNTNPPPPSPPPPSPLPPSGSSPPSVTHVHISATHATPYSSSGHSCFSAAPEDYHPALSTINGAHNPVLQQPSRTIQFEDSCPEAVRAVIQYIYLGQKPILEPYCGYTVKDLMALASYLQIPPLEEYCVQLVVGTHRDTTTSTSASDDEYGSGTISYNSKYSHEQMRRLRLKSRISPKTAVQVLFDWGYRYPKIRTALVCALIESDLFSSEDVLFGQGEEEGGSGLLRSFGGHEAFHSILCEMVERQLSRSLV